MTELQTMPEPAQQFDAALSTLNPRQMMGVAAEHIDTPVGAAAVKAADLMVRGKQDFDRMVAPIEQAGGVGTPQGNIAAAKVAQTYFKQEEPRWGQALLHYLAGNKEMGQALITGGNTVSSIVPDVNGTLVQVTKNQLGKIVDARELGSANPISEQEYQQRAIGRQSYENLLTFKNQEQQQKDNIAALKESQKVNNAYISVSPQFESKYGQLYDDLDFIKGKDLKSKEFADILKFASNSLGSADSSSKGLTILDQAQQNRATNAGKTLTKDQTSMLGLPAGIWKWTNRGIETEDGKKSFSFDELKQNTSTENRSSELTRNFQQTQRNLVESEKFKKLDSNEQKRLLNALNVSLELGQKQLELARNVGTPTFMVLPTGFDIEDKYTMGQIKAVQGMFNAKAMQLYSDYERKALAQSGGVAPNPKELEAGFTRTPQYRQLLDAARQRTSDLLNEGNAQIDVTFPAAEAPAKAPKAPPKQSESKRPTLDALRKLAEGR